MAVGVTAWSSSGCSVRALASEALHRRRGAWHGADSCLGIELLPAGNMADPIANGLGLSRTIVFGVFPGALPLSAVLEPPISSVSLWIT